jgi:hypothetical protein
MIENLSFSETELRHNSWRTRSAPARHERQNRIVLNRASRAERDDCAQRSPKGEAESRVKSR